MAQGVKSASERFAGAEETYTIEALMQNGWALQSGTSHFLGQNFAKAFDVTYQTADNEQELVWASSWGVSTRLVGALVMSHSDDNGLVLPPAVAPIQVVVVPISKGPEKAPEEHAELMGFVDRAVESMRKEKIRVHVDERYALRPGNKYFEWERRGVPLRLEIGPRDMGAGHAMVARRVGADGKAAVTVDGDFGAKIAETLAEVHRSLYDAARARLEERTFEVSAYEEMKSALEGSDSGGAKGWFLVPWRDDAAAEEAIKTETKATIRCYPLDRQAEAEGRKCFYSGEPATHMAIFARAF